MWVHIQRCDIRILYSGRWWDKSTCVWCAFATECTNNLLWLLVSRIHIINIIRFHQWCGIFIIIINKAGVFEWVLEVYGENIDEMKWYNSSTLMCIYSHFKVHILYRVGIRLWLPWIIHNFIMILLCRIWHKVLGAGWSQCSPKNTTIIR